MRFLSTICLLLAAATAQAAFIGKQVNQADISIPLGYDLIYQKLVEVNSLAHEFQNTGSFTSAYRVVITEEQLEKLFENSTLQCTELQRQFTPDEAKLLFNQTTDILKQFGDSLQTFIALKKKYRLVFNAAGFESRIKQLEDHVDRLEDCFKTHLSDEMAMNATEVREQFDKLFANAYAPTESLRPPEAAKLIYTLLL